MDTYEERALKAYFARRKKQNALREAAAKRFERKQRNKLIALTILFLSVLLTSLSVLSYVAMVG